MGSTKRWKASVFPVRQAREKPDTMKFAGQMRTLARTASFFFALGKARPKFRKKPMIVSTEMRRKSGEPSMPFVSKENGMRRRSRVARPMGAIATGSSRRARLRHLNPDIRLYSKMRI